MKSIRYSDIKFDILKLKSFCKEKDIRTLYLFGSVFQGGFKRGTSDIDFLAEMCENSTSDLNKRESLEKALSTIIGYPYIHLNFFVELAQDGREEFYSQATRLV